MINLIPPSAQKQVTREYWTRVVSVWAILLGSAFGMIAILLIPVYVLLHTQLNTYQQEYTQMSSQSEQYVDAETAIKNTNAVAKLLTEPNTGMLFSTIISEIEAATPAGVSITSFAFSRTKTAVSPVTITGQATTRSELSSFRDTLEQNPLFKSAVLPLANLAKDKDIQFSISVTLQSGDKQ